jgi:small neutral amino acid transporter SnatA (MarC family)
MTLTLFVLAAVCAVNAPRCRTAVPSGALPRARVAALGAGLTLAALAVLALLADPLLDLVGIAAATARLAAGLLLLVTGLLTFSWPTPAPEPALPGWRAAVVPVAFPTLLMPGLALLTVCASVDHSAAVAVGGTGLALATLPALVALGVGTSVRERVLDGTALVLSGLLMLAGFGLLMDGVFDI